MATKEILAKRRAETAKTNMQYLINREKEEKERVKRATDAKNREDALKMDFRQNMAPKIIRSLFGDDNPQQAKVVNTSITSVAPTYSTSTPQIQPVAAPKEETAQQGVPAMPSKKVATSTPPPASPSPQEQVIETPKENSVLTPEPQSLVITPKDDNVLTAAEAAAERNRIATDTQAALTQNHPEEVKRLNYEAMTKMLNEQGEQGRAKKAEDEEKRRRRKQLFNAIGDGVAALSNLYFTTQGAPSVQYDPRNSLTARSRARWDAIDANRKAEEEKAYVLQQQAMDRALEEAKERRAEQHQAERDRIADERYKEEKARQDRQRAEDVAYREAQVQRDQEKWKAQLAAQEKNTQATQAGLNYRAKLSADTQAAKMEASTAKAKRGKPMQFSDGKNTVSIYENVWEPSMQQVYDAMVADGIEDTALKYGATAAQIENFVKQNWTKSAKAKELMKILSKIDPAAEYSNIEDEDYSQYEVGNEEDYSQYEVK